MLIIEEKHGGVESDLPPCLPPDQRSTLARLTTTVERRPINRDQLSFTVVTYNMASLMASKVAAIFLRGTRGVGEAVYQEKGRDIYDLLWYMNKKVLPDFDYLYAKGIDIRHPRALFDKLTLRMNKVDNDNLEHDLTPLFTDRTYIRNWLGNWRESFLRMLDNYTVRTVKELVDINIHQDFNTDNFSFKYRYTTQEGVNVKVTYVISSYWIEDHEGKLPTEINRHITECIKGDVTDRLSTGVKQYATLFYQKTEAYFAKLNRVMLGDTITTKLIRMTADNFNPRQQIVLTTSTLLNSELDDLLA